MLSGGWHTKGSARALRGCPGSLPGASLVQLVQQGFVTRLTLTASGTNNRRRRHRQSAVLESTQQHVQPCQNSCSVELLERAAAARVPAFGEALTLAGPMCKVGTAAGVTCSNGQATYQLLLVPGVQGTAPLEASAHRLDMQQWTPVGHGRQTHPHFPIHPEDRLSCQGRGTPGSTSVFQHHSAKGQAVLTTGPAYSSDSTVAPSNAAAIAACASSGSWSNAVTPEEHLASCARHLGLSARTLTRHPRLAAALQSMPRPQAAAVLLPALRSALAVGQHDAVTLLLAQPEALVGLVCALEAGIAGAQLGQVYKVFSNSQDHNTGVNALSRASHTPVTWTQASNQRLVPAPEVQGAVPERHSISGSQAPVPASLLVKDMGASSLGRYASYKSPALQHAAELAPRSTLDLTAGYQVAFTSMRWESEQHEQAPATQGAQAWFTAETRSSGAGVQQGLLAAAAAGALEVRAAEVAELLVGPGAPPQPAAARSAVLQAPELLSAPPGRLRVGLLGLARGLDPHLPGGLAAVLPLVRRCPALLAHPGAALDGSHVEGVLMQLADCCGTSTAQVSLWAAELQVLDGRRSL
jgi:hypothetical protein